MRIFLYALFITILPACGSAQERWGTPFDDVIKKEQIVVKIKKNTDGTETREINLPGKIFVQESRKDGRVFQTYAADRSGHGAIRCVKGIYVEVKTWLDVCSDFNNQKSSEILASAIKRINKFIVKNSLHPISMDELNASLAAHQNNFRAMLIEAHKTAGVTDGEKLLQCREKQNKPLGFHEKMADGIAKMPAKEFDQSIDDLLSVPRLPVMNPCL